MKALLLAPALLLTQIGSAAELQVRTLVTPGRNITIEQCSCPEPEGAALKQTATHRSYPGAIELDITGGVAPYRIIWHDAPRTGLLALSVMPGEHRVTVIDAEGTSVTRSVHVGAIRGRYRRTCPCDPEPVRSPAPAPAPRRPAPVHQHVIGPVDAGTPGRPVVGPVGKGSGPTPVVDHGRDTGRAVDHFTGGGGNGGSGNGNKHVVVQPVPPVPVQRR